MKKNQQPAPTDTTLTLRVLYDTTRVPGKQDSYAKAERLREQYPLQVAFAYCLNAEYKTGIFNSKSSLSFERLEIALSSNDRDIPLGIESSYLHAPNGFIVASIHPHGMEETLIVMLRHIGYQAKQKSLPAEIHLGNGTRLPLLVNSDDEIIKMMEYDPSSRLSMAEQLQAHLNGGTLDEESLCRHLFQNQYGVPEYKMPISPPPAPLHHEFPSMYLQVDLSEYREALSTTFGLNAMQLEDMGPASLGQYLASGVTLSRLQGIQDGDLVELSTLLRDPTLLHDPRNQALFYSAVSQTAPNSPLVREIKRIMKIAGASGLGYPSFVKKTYRLTSPEGKPLEIEGDYSPQIGGDLILFSIPDGGIIHTLDSLAPQLGALPPAQAGDWISLVEEQAKLLEARAAALRITAMVLKAKAGKLTP